MLVRLVLARAGRQGAPEAVLVLEVVEDVPLMPSCLVHLVLVASSWARDSSLEGQVLDIACVRAQALVSLGKLEK